MPRQLAHHNSSAARAGSAATTAPRHHVAVAVEVLGDGVHHQVGAQRDGALKDRRQEGVVHHDQRAGRRRTVRDGPDVGDAQQGVAGCFDPHQPGAVGEHLRWCRGGQIGVPHPQDAEPGQPVEKAPGPSITVVRRDDQTAGAEDLEGKANRRHAGAGHHAAGAALEPGNGIDQELSSGVAAPCIVVGPGPLEFLEAEIGRQVNRRNDCTESGIGGDAGADRAGGWVHDQGTWMGVRTSSRIWASAAGSFRKASWP